jgi:trans-2,3-dihydro-3-hydroxyanthranilate isomerase
MRWIEALKVDAFTDRAYAGNTAGVVPGSDGLTDAQMQAVAREMNLSETAFVLSPTVAGADLKLRYFTPTTEVPLCGHATVGALHALVEAGRLRAPAQLRVETNAGVLPLEVRDGPTVFLTSPDMPVRPSPLAADELARLLGAEAAALSALLQVNDDVCVTLRGLDALAKLRPDMDRLAEACRRAGLQGVVAVSEETRSPEARTHIRYFVPAVGIPEDPVTGVAHMELARYLLATGRLDAPARFTGEQGDSVGRPGQVLVEVDGTREAPVVRVGGRAVTVLRGEMRVTG